MHVCGQAFGDFALANFLSPLTPIFAWASPSFGFESVNFIGFTADLSCTEPLVHLMSVLFNRRGYKILLNLLEDLDWAQTYVGELALILSVLRRIYTISSRNHGVHICMHQQTSPETQTTEMNVELHVRSSLKTIRSTLIVNLYQIKLTILASNYCKSTN